MLNFIFETYPAEVWYGVSGLMLVLGGWMMSLGKRRLSWLGLLLVCIASFVLWKGFDYSHSVLGHGRESSRGRF